MDSLLKTFQHAKILIIGDVMIDCYLRGKVTRISPEAPVPIMDIKQRENRLGGAANVAVNIRALGANPILYSVIGNDERKKILEEELGKQNIADYLLIEEADRKTTTKYRIIGNQMQMLRLDDEDIRPIAEESENQIIEKIEKLISQKKVDAVILVDYDKGMMTPTLIEKICTICQQHHIIVTVDPKKKNFHNYKGVTLFKPNRKEFQEGLGESHHLSINELHNAMKAFAIRQNIDSVMTTLSEEGLAIYDRENDLFIHQPTHQHTICDVSGAGDTVISIVTLCLIQKLPLDKIAKLANLGGGVVCEYSGVVPLTAGMLKEEYGKRREGYNI